MKKTLIFSLAWLGCTLGFVSASFPTDATAQIIQATIPDTPVAAKIVPRATHARFMSIAINQEGGLLAVGERGIIIRSTDQGATWKQMPSPVDITLASVLYETSQKVWAVGQAATILRSENGGQTWRIMHYKPSDLRYYLKVVIRNGVIYITGSDGELFTSRDDGAKWQMTTMDTGEMVPHLFSLAFVGQTGILSAERGSVFLRDGDDGVWKPLAVAYNGSFFGVTSFADHFLLFGMSGRAFLVNPDGSNQRIVDTRTTQFLLDAAVLPEQNQALMVGRGGAIVVVDANGQVIKSYQRPDNADITAIAVHGDAVYLTTMKGGVQRFKTSDLLQGAEALPTAISK